MNRVIKIVSGLGAAAWLCLALALGAVGLAFPGAERASAFMTQPPMLGGVGVLALLFLFVGLRAVRRRRIDSVLLHCGCALVMVGWLWGRCEERYHAPEHPVKGSMVLVDGEESDQLWRGSQLDEFVGRIPFSVKLERFIIERYERSADDRVAGRDAPIKEYRSRVKISEKDQGPYFANIRVNYPLYVKGYHIYQLSWGYSTDRLGRPLTYTVLQFIRDPGLPLAFSGFAVLFLGILLFLGRVWRTRTVGEATAQHQLKRESEVRRGT